MRALMFRHPWQFIADVTLATTRAARRRGLLGRRSLEPDTGLVLVRCGSVHTFFMQFAIDILFLDADHRVVRVACGVPPSRLVWGGWGAKTTIELPAGQLSRTPVVPGDTLTFLAADPGSARPRV